jgi:hypothetical protein
LSIKACTPYPVLVKDPVGVQSPPPPRGARRCHQWLNPSITFRSRLKADHLLLHSTAAASCNASFRRCNTAWLVCPGLSIGGGGGHGTGTNPEQMTPLAPAPQGKFFRFFGFYRGKAPHWQSCDPPVSPYSGLYSISLDAEMPGLRDAPAYERESNDTLLGSVFAFGYR